MTHERDDDARLDARARAAYLRPAPGDDASVKRTLARLRSEGARPRAGVLGAWFSPRPFTLAPLAAAALLVATLGAGALLGLRLAPILAARHDAGAARIAGAATGATLPVTFVLRAPGATRVTVAGDWNGWDTEATPLSRAGSGDLWLVRAVVPSGVHEYAFVLDGREWRPDPAAPLAPAAAFGRTNSVLVVGGGSPL